MTNIMSRLLAVFSALVLMLLLNGCGEQPQPAAEKAGEPAVEIKKETGVSAEDVKQETKEALEAAKTYAMQQKEEYQKKMDAELKELDTQIQKLKAEARESTAEARDRLEKRIREMEAKREVAGKKLEEIKRASVEAWENLKSDMDGIMSDIKKIIKDIIPPFE